MKRQIAMKSGILLLMGLALLTLKNQAQTVTDYDGNVYDTVMIGTRVWLKENLKVTHYNSGVLIPNVKDNSAWGALLTGARCYYNNDSLAYDSIYGALYNWYAINNSDNICPAGWHASTDADWIEAENYFGGIYIAGGKMKEAGFLHWKSPNTGADNSSGFTGLPGGFRNLSNTFQAIHENGLWWRYTAGATTAKGCYMWYMFAGVESDPVPKYLALSVRCVKNIATGLGNTNLPGTINLYPNPSNYRIIIDCKNCQNVKVLVCNLLGENVMQWILTDSKNEIDISSLAKGVYILRMTCEQGIIQQKLIKE